MTELAALNVKIEGDASGLNASLNRAESSVQSFGAQADRATKQTGLLGNSFGKLSNLSGNTRSQIANVGYQVQDLAVQLQSGTSASVAFAQQGSQLLSAFGPVGAVLGTLAAVGIPALAFAFQDAGSEASDLESRLESLGALSEELAGYQKTLALTVDELKTKYGEYADVVRDATSALTALTIGEIQRELNTALGGMDDGISRLNQLLNASGRNAKNAAALMKSEFGLSKDAATALRDALLDVANAQDMKTRMEAIGALGDLINQAGIDTGKIPEELEQAIKNALLLSGQFALLSEQARQAGEAINNPPPEDEGEGGGGRRGLTPEEENAREMERLQQQLMTEEEAIYDSYARRQEILNQFLQMNNDQQDQYNELSLRNQQAYQDAMARIDALRQRNAISGFKSMFGDMATLMQSGSKEMFNIGKAFAIAEAVISGWQAATDAWAKGMKIGGPPVAAAFTAASLAKTGMMISSIASTQPGGSRSQSAPTVTSAAPVAAATMQTAEAAPMRNVAIQLTGGDMFSRDQVIGLINSINEAVEDGAIVRVV